MNNNNYTFFLYEVKALDSGEFRVKFQFDTRFTGDIELLKSNMKDVIHTEIESQRTKIRYQHLLINIEGTLLDSNVGLELYQIIITRVKNKPKNYKI